MCRVGAISHLILMTIVMLAPSGGVQAQLLSPGKLAEPHRDLEGVRNCTNCHELRTRGASNVKCLACHEPLQNRVSQQQGFHASAKVAGEDCGSCHKDHFGRDFQMLRFDTTNFDHSEVGFRLVESHGELDCRDCHNAALVTATDVRAFKGKYGALDRTFLGAGTTCVGCHTADDPHEKQFPRRGCEDCHGEVAWEEAEHFDHNKTRYRLTGLHRRVACEDCHESIRRGRNEAYVQYVGIEFAACESCHEDVHEGQLGKRCTDCHTTGGWHRIARRSAFEDGFDHEATDFSLVGKHAELECADCHGTPPAQGEWLQIRYQPRTQEVTYPHPVADDCVSCHRDYHRSVFVETRGGIACDNCHNEDVWAPAEYDIERHNRESSYELTGAHVAAPCFVCHESPNDLGRATRFRVDADNCELCHQPDAPHEAQFPGEPCEDCHDTQSWRIAVFDHSQTDYPLDGEHKNVPCEPCHEQVTSADGAEFVRYKPLDTACGDCHGGG